ncbi:winged helix-turn-helix domain-containing protein [Burkholderia cepacia]|uniref:winged helix-turn-helix domain-containing protein n=1 Tax=Burkholderia cepacia TaxID=292 RepID=UPI000B2551CF|nr:winged helix-turn-helix domain-containing protein [Burkholderia cepacia]
MHNETILSFKQFRFSSDGILTYNCNAVPLATKERKLLSALLLADGRIVIKEDLARAGWGHAEISDESLTRAIYVLRRTLVANAPGKYIETCYGRGYRFLCPVQRLASKAIQAVKLVLLPSDQLELSCIQHALIQCLTSDNQKWLSVTSTPAVAYLLAKYDRLEAINCLDVDYYASMGQTGSTLRIELANASTHEVIASAPFRMDNVGAIARRLCAWILSCIPQVRPPLPLQGTEQHTFAFQQALESLHTQTPRRLEPAAGLFQPAPRAEPRHIPSLCGLGDVIPPSTPFVS